MRASKLHVGLPNVLKYAILNLLLMDDKSANITEENNAVMHSFSKTSTPPNKKILILLAIVASLGLGTGFTLAKYSESSGKKISIFPSGSSATKGKIYGSEDLKTFKDTAEGIVKKGGVEGEGQFHLERTGGESQNVYMTSSLVDLSQFIGKKIKVWGETQKAQTAGWLMDVGRVEVL